MSAGITEQNIIDEMTQREFYRAVAVPTTHEPEEVPPPVMTLAPSLTKAEAIACGVGRALNLSNYSVICNQARCELPQGTYDYTVGYGLSVAKTALLNGTCAYSPFWGIEGRPAVFPAITESDIEEKLTSLRYYRAADTPPIIPPVYTPPVIPPVYTPPIIPPVYTPPVIPPVYTPPVLPPESPPVSPAAKSTLLLISGIALAAMIMADEG